MANVVKVNEVPPVPRDITGITLELTKSELEKVMALLGLCRDDETARLFMTIDNAVPEGMPVNTYRFRDQFGDIVTTLNLKPGTTRYTS